MTSSGDDGSGRLDEEPAASEADPKAEAAPVEEPVDAVVEPETAAEAAPVEDAALAQEPAAASEPNPVADAAPGEDIAPGPQAYFLQEWVPRLVLLPQPQPGDASTPSKAGATSDGGQKEPQDVDPATERELDFQTDMCNRFEYLWIHRVEPSRQLLDQVVETLHRYATLERRHGEGLGSFTLLPNGSPGAGGEQLPADTVRRAAEAMVVNLKNRAQQSWELADKVEDVAFTLEAVSLQHTAVTRQLFGDVQLLSRNVHDARSSHQQAARRYGATCAAAEAAAAECLQSWAMPSAPRMKKAMRAADLSKQARADEAEYYKSIERCNAAQALYDQHMPAVLSTLQEMEEKRGKCMRDSLMRLAVHEASWLRNLQYDLEGAANAAEAASPLEDIREFIRQHRHQPMEKVEAAPSAGGGSPARVAAATGSAVRLVPMPFWQPPADVVLSKREGTEQKAAFIRPAPGPPAKGSRQAEAQAAVRRYGKELGPLLDHLLRKPPDGTGTETSGHDNGFTEEALTRITQEVAQQRRGMGDACRRTGLCGMLRGAVIMRRGAGDISQEVESVEEPMVLMPAAFEVLVPLVKSVLDACIHEHDLWCGRDIVVISQLFVTKNDAGKTMPLLAKIYDHPLWSMVSFWEDLLIMALCEAQCAESMSRRSQLPGSCFGQPAVTRFLQRFVGYMISFGITYSQGRQAVSLALKKCEAILSASPHAYAELLLSPHEPAAWRSGRSTAAGEQDQTQPDPNREAEVEAQAQDGAIRDSGSSPTDA